MRRASTKLLEMRSQAPSPVPDLTPNNVQNQQGHHIETGRPNRDTSRLGLPNQEVLSFNTLYILTRHPLAFRALEGLLGSTNYLTLLTCPIVATPDKGRILILDTHSVKEWPVIVSQCKLSGGRSLILVDEVPGAVDEEVRLILLGVHGIVLFDEIEQGLPKAINEITGHGLWVSRKGLAEYIMRANTGHLLTHREEEVVYFLKCGLSNKEIGQSLHIAERTVKFHVSNVLAKCNVKSRKQLVG